MNLFIRSTEGCADFQTAGKIGLAAALFIDVGLDYVYADGKMHGLKTEKLKNSADQMKILRAKISCKK